MKWLFFLFLLLSGFFQPDLFAQQKLERESRMKSADVPQAALRFIEAVEMQTRWKWYYEENLVGNSIEAKTKYRGKWYSVEFDTSGRIQDVEVEINMQEMDEPVHRNISKSLDSMFFQHHMNKIQIQYSAEKNVLLAILNMKRDHTDSKIQYEIVVKGKRRGRPKLYELTFSDKGELLDSAEIIFRNTSNLEF